MVHLYCTISTQDITPANHVQPSRLPNLRRLFVEARSEAEESAYSRNAVSFSHIWTSSSHLTIL